MLSQLYQYLRNVQIARFEQIQQQFSLPSAMLDAMLEHLVRTNKVLCYQRHQGNVATNRAQDVYCLRG